MSVKDSEDCYVNQHRGRIYMAISACAQEVKFVIMLIEEMTEVQNLSVIYKDNQGAIFLAKNRQVCMRTMHIDIPRHFLRDMVEDKDIDIKDIWSEENPTVIMTKNTCEADFVKRMKRITEGELWELVETGRDNVNISRVTDKVMERDKTEYSSQALAEVVDGENKNDWILVTKYRIGK